MLVRVEMQFDDDTELSITQRDLLASASSNRAGGEVLLMGRTVGRMITALAAGSDVSSDVMVEEFQKAVLQSARRAKSDMEHTCDGVGCC